MDEIHDITKRPFKANPVLDGPSLGTLMEWLEEHADPNLVLAGEYRMSDMLADFDNILDGMWSDGIDSMGEDA